MHELSLAAALVGQIEDAMDREGATEVVTIYVTIGSMSGVMADAFEFAFPMAVEGTRVEGVALVIEEVPLTVQCRQCGKESTPEFPMVECLHCGTFDVEVTRGKEFTITSMEVR